MTNVIVGLDQYEGDREIEVTPEMIEAGVDELLLFEPGEDDARLSARLIFEAMVRAMSGSQLSLGQYTE